MFFKFSFKYYVPTRWFSTETEQHGPECKGTLYTLILIKIWELCCLGFFLVQIIFLHLGEWISLHGPAWSGTKSTFSASKHTGNRVAPTPCGFSKNCDTHWLGMLPDVFLSPAFNIRNNNLQSTAVLRETRTTA